MQNKKRTILLVDNDKLVMPYYIRALEGKGFQVKQVYNPDDAHDFMRRQKRAEISASILNIMMRPGEVYKDKDTNEGLRTGVFLYRDFRKKNPDLPIVILTNVTNRGTLTLFREEPKLKVLQKREYPPYRLAELVEEMIEKNGSQPNGSELKEVVSGN